MDPHLNLHLHAFATLAAHRGTIVVPDTDTQRALDRALDVAAAANPVGAWRPPAVLAWPALLTRQFEDVQRNGVAPQGVDFVLSPEQELALWQQVVAADNESSVGEM